MMLDQVSLKEALDYDPETGVFTWAGRKQGRKVGSRAGHTKSFSRLGHEYISISVNNRKYLAHRLAWLWMTGSFPPPGLEVDHADGDGTNNRWENLRLATRSQNLHNAVSRKNKAGMKGVYEYPNGFFAKICKQGVKRRWGPFETAIEAHQKYCEEAERLFGEFANSGNISQNF